jgi:Fe-S cluster assembly scaffold protein SufB
MSLPDLSKYQLGWSDDQLPVFKAQKGLNENVVREMSAMKSEPAWMLKFRLDALKRFEKKPMLPWFADRMPDLDFDDIYYYVKPTEGQVDSWEDLPPEIKRTYDRLGIPEAERNFLAGVTAQYESEVVFHRNREDLASLGVLFCDMDTAVRDYPDIVRKYFATVIPPGDNKFAALNSAVWSGGSFIYVPPGVTVDQPLQAYFRINSENMGQFERTLIIADEGSKVTYFEGCVLAGTQITRPGGGTTSIEELREGDLVLDATGKETTVTKTMSRKYNGNLHRLSLLSRDSEICATEEHPILMVPQHKALGGVKPEWVPISEVHVGDFLVYPASEHATAGSIRHESPEESESGAHKTKEGWLVPVKNEKVAHYTGDVYNIATSSESYLVNGLAVHNCSAPIYTTSSLHSAVVELVALPGAQIAYTTLQNWNDRLYNLVTKRARAEAEAHVSWTDANIGCLAAGSLITTPAGPRPIESLTVGDMVQSFDEASGQLVFRKVTAKSDSGMQPVREVRLGTNILRATDNHPFYSYTYDENIPKKLCRYNLGYVRADKLEKAIIPVGALDYGEPHRLESMEPETSYSGGNQWGGSFTATRTRPQRVFGGDETSDDIMWLLGLFVGDGSIQQKKANNGGILWGKVTFSVPKTDRVHERLLQVMEALMPGVVPNIRRDNIAATWSSVELVKLFEDNGFIGATRTKRIPEWVLDLPQSQRLSFIAGYLDSDGCASKGRSGFSIKSVNSDLLRDTAKVLTSLGIVSRLHTEYVGERAQVILGHHATGHASHVLMFRADPRLIPLVTPGLRAATDMQLTSRNKFFRKVGRSTIKLPGSVEIRTVDVSDEHYMAPTWDIEVEGTGNFVAEGFIVHNSKLTMKYPSVYLVGPKASGEVLSAAYAGAGQVLDTGAKMIHAAPETTSTIIAKSVSKDGGLSAYRGLVKVEEGATGSKSFVRCDALILDEESTSETRPYMEIDEQDASIGHEATVAKIGDDQLFYLMSRGLTEVQAMGMIVNGFIEPVVRAFPPEYSVEFTRLIEMSMENSIG